MLPLLSFMVDLQVNYLCYVNNKLAHISAVERSPNNSLPLHRTHGSSQIAVVKRHMSRSLVRQPAPTNPQAIRNRQNMKTIVITISRCGKEKYVRQ